MATKGQRFKKYPKELKEQILKEYMEGCGWRIKYQNVMMFRW